MLVGKLGLAPLRVNARLGLVNLTGDGRILFRGLESKANPLYNARARRGVRAVEGAGLENR